MAESSTQFMTSVMQKIRNANDKSQSNNLSVITGNAKKVSKPNSNQYGNYKAGDGSSLEQSTNASTSNGLPTEYTIKDERNGWQRFWDTLQDVGNKVAEGVLNFVDGIFDAGAYVVGLFGDDGFKQIIQDTMNYDWQAQVLEYGEIMNPTTYLMTGDIFSGEYWKKFGTLGSAEEARAELNKTAQSSFQSDWGGFGDFLTSAEEGIGYVLPSIVVGILSGGSSVGIQAAMLGATAVSAFGSGTNEALNEGADYGQAAASGAITGAIEVGTELASMGVGKIAGKIVGKTTSFGTHIGGMSAGKAIAKLSAKELGQAALEEGAEEFISELLSPLAKEVYKPGSMKASWTVGTQENQDMWKSAAISGFAGAVGGAFGAGVNGVMIKSKISNTGIDLANDVAELRNLHEEAIKEAQKGSLANQELITQYENRIGELSKSFETRMEQFKKDSPREFKNLMKMLKNPSEYIKQLKKENVELSKAQIQEYKNSYLDNYEDITNTFKQDTYEKVAQLNSNNNGKIKIGQVSDFDIKNFSEDFIRENGIKEGEVIKAFYDPKTKTTLINPQYKAQFYELAAHENISHGILDTNERVRTQLENAIENDKALNKLYHSQDTKLERIYGKQGKNVVAKERMAHFLENFVKNQKDYSKVLRLRTSQNKLLNVLNKIKNSIILTKDSKFLKQVEKAIARVQKQIDYNETTVLKPQLAFSRTDEREPGVATGTEVHADIIKNSAQALQDRFINLSTVEDTYKLLIDEMKTTFKAKDIKIKGTREMLSRETFVAFNTLLNKPEQLNSHLESVVDSLLDAKVVFKNEQLSIDGSPIDVTRDTTIREILGDEDIVNEYKTNSVQLLNEILNATSKKTKIVKIREFYKSVIEDLSNKVVQYKYMSREVVNAYEMWTKNKEFLEKNKLAVRKVGDAYTAKLNFYNEIFKGRFRVGKSGVSPSTITNIVNAMQTYNEENITKLSGEWTDTNKQIKESVDYLRSKFNKEGKFPTRPLSLEEVSNLNTVLKGIRQEMKELSSKEGQARYQALNEADIHLNVINDSYKKNAKLGLVQRELNYTSSMDVVMANFFGTDSPIHHILYDNVFDAFDSKYIEQGKMRNAFIDKLTKYDLWSKSTSSPKQILSKKIEFHGKTLTKAHLMDIYAQTLTARGLATLQKGGYAWKLDGNRTRQSLVFNADMISELNTLLTDSEMSFVEEVVTDLYNGQWKEYKASRDERIKGFKDVLNDEVYYPTNKADVRASGFDEMNFANLDLSNQSFNKRRVKNTDHLTLLGMSFIDRANAYMDGLTRYGELTQATKMFDSLTKQWTTTKDGRRMSRDALFDENIPQWKEYKNFLIEQITGQTQNRAGEGRLFGNLVSATLYGNASVVLKQAASLPIIMNEVSTKSFFKAITTGWKNLAQYNTTKQHIENLSGIANQRWANFDAVASNILTSEVSKIGKIFGIPMEKMDEGVIVLFGWSAAQYEAEARYGYKVGTAENDTQAAKILNKIIANTQSNSIPINMSMARAGAAGRVRKLLSYFSSDLQNKVSRLNKIINESRYAKKRLGAINDSLVDANKTLTQAQTKLENFKVENADIANLEEALIPLQNEVNQAQDQVDILTELKTKEETIIAGDRRVTEALKYAISTFLSALMVAGIDQLIQRLYGRKGWDENTLDEFWKDLLIEGTINNLPYMSNIVNAIQYSQDIGGYDLTMINSALDVIKDVKNMIEKGKFDPNSLIEIGTTLGQATGLPLKNIYNLVMGVWKNVDGSGYSAEATIRGYSDTYITKQYKEAIEKGNSKKADACLDILMKTYKTGSSTTIINNELNRLTKEGYNVLPKNAMTNYEDENGEKITLSQTLKTKFNKLYSKSTTPLQKLLTSSDYRNLNSEEKARVIRRYYSYYYGGAKGNIIGVYDSKTSYVVGKTNGNVETTKISLSLDHISSLEATNTKTKKQLAVEYVNKLNVENGMKYLILKLAGFGLKESAQGVLKNYLIKNGMSSKEASEFVK